MRRSKMEDTKKLFSVATIFIGIQTCSKVVRSLTCGQDELEKDDIDLSQRRYMYRGGQVFTHFQRRVYQRMC